MAAGLPVPKRVTSQRLVDGRRREDEQVARQRHRAAPAGGDVRTRPGRYFLLREKPFGGDGTLSHQALITRINVELANDLGNLAQRSLSLIARNCDGRLPGRGAATDGGCGPADGGGGAARAGARAAGPSGLPRGAGGCLESRPRRQRLHRPPGTLGFAPDRSGADGSGAAGAGRRAAGDRHGAAAVHAREHGPDAGPARGAGACAATGGSGAPLADAAPCRRRRACSRATWSRRPRAR